MGWRVALSGMVLQLTLGTIYAWSFFQKPLMAWAGWNNQQVAWVLSLSICFLGLAAAAGGFLLPRLGPRKLAVTGALLYAAGWAVGGLALESRNLPLLYLGLGAIGGTGLGLGYVTPVATAARWFPRNKGLVTGTVVMGFGFGAMLMSKLIAPLLMEAHTAPQDGMVVWPAVFHSIALLVALPGVGAALMLKNPPADQALASGAGSGIATWSRPGWLQSGRFWRVWLVFLCNITAGMMLIGFQSPMFQDVMKAKDAFMSTEALAAAGGSLIAMSSAFNGLGRIFWGSLSDRLGRLWTFRTILLSQAAAFMLLTQVADPWLFGVLICYILLCYGGGFGTMPSLVATIFGARAMATVYGSLLTAWAVAGLAGPQIAAVIIDRQGADPAHGAGLIFLVGATLLALGALLACSLDDAAFEISEREGAMANA